MWSKSSNRLGLVGRLASFVNIKETKTDNKPYLYFSLAVTNKDETTDFFNIFSFSPELLKLADLVTKGSPIVLRAHLKSFWKNQKKELMIILDDYKLLETADQLRARKNKILEKEKDKNNENLVQIENLNNQEDDEDPFEGWDLEGVDEGE